MDNLPPLIVSQDPLSDIQIVCNYFHQAEQINAKDIYIPDPKLKRSKGSLTIEVLSAQHCEKIIKEKFNITNPTYYQISSFINLLATEFRMFSQSIYLNVDLLRQNGQVKQQDLLKVCRLVLDSLTKVTISITKGAYSNIISEQKDTYDKILDSNQAEKKAVERLNKPEQISFDMINPSLVLFNEDKQSLSIISTAAKNSAEYKALKQLMNASTPTTEIELSDYKSMDKEMFLSEVKNVLNLRNCITEEEKQKQNSKLDSIESIVGSYIFTADNYIKMVMILLRIRSRIPVIMMVRLDVGKHH